MSALCWTRIAKWSDFLIEPVFTAVNNDVIGDPLASLEFTYVNSFYWQALWRLSTFVSTWWNNVHLPLMLCSEWKAEMFMVITKHIPYRITVFHSSQFAGISCMVQSLWPALRIRRIVLKWRSQGVSIKEWVLLSYMKGFIEWQTMANRKCFFKPGLAFDRL